MSYFITWAVIAVLIMIGLPAGQKVFRGTDFFDDFSDREDGAVFLGLIGCCWPLALVVGAIGGTIYLLYLGMLWLMEQIKSLYEEYQQDRS